MSAGVKGGSAPEREAGVAAMRGFLGCCSPHGASARSLQRAALPVPSRGDAVTSLSRWQRTRSRLRRERDGRCQTPCVCTSIFTSIRGFFGNLQNQTRASRTLSGGRHVPTNFPGRQK